MTDRPSQESKIHCPKCLLSGERREIVFGGVDYRGWSRWGCRACRKFYGYKPRPRRGKDGKVLDGVQ